MAARLVLRWATPDDDVALGEVMFDAVHNGAGGYSAAQRRAWVPEPRRGPDWRRRLDGQDIMLAEDPERVAGFMSLAPEGYLDFAYIRPDFQGRGLFRRLYEKIEALAVDQKQLRIRVHASLTAQPAFSAMGFKIIRKESVEISGQSLDRFEMEKHLGA